MKIIDFDEFKKRDFDQTMISNHKLTNGVCVRCGGLFSYSCVKKFLRNRKNKKHLKDKWQTCQKCWLVINTSEDKKWIEKNRQAQLIAQNKPEQKLKNAQGVSRSWTKDRRKKASDALKEKWKNDEHFAKQGLKNISWTQTIDDRHEEIQRKAIGSGGLKGIYNNIRYDSALELSYLLWCEDNSIEIKRYDLEPINYKAEDGKNRKYIPDFIESRNIIVEIKGSGLYYRKNYQRNLLKMQALKNNGAKYKILFEKDHPVKYNYKKARRLHHEIKKKEKNSL